MSGSGLVLGGPGSTTLWLSSCHPSGFLFFCLLAEIVTSSVYSSETSWEGVQFCFHHLHRILCLSISAGDSCALEACHQSLRLTASVRVWGSTKSVPYLRDTAFLNFLQSLKTGNFPQICSTWSLLPDIVPGTLQMPLFVFFPARASHVQCAASFWFFFWLHLFCLLLACFLHMTRSWLKMNCSVQY